MTIRLLKTFEDENNFNNVIVPLSIDVDEVVFVFHHNVDKEKLKNCKEIIKKYKNIKISFVKVNEKTINKQIKENTIIDVTATKYLSIVLCEIAFKNDIDIIYYDEEEKVIKKYNNHSIYVKDNFKLSINDIIKCGGGKIISNMHKASTKKETIDSIYEVVEKNSKNYNEFISYVSRISKFLHNNKKRNNTYLLSDEEVRKIINDEEYSKYKKLSLFKLKDNKLIFLNNEIENCFLISGMFLENYIYHKLSSSKAFDEVLMSSYIEFSDKWHFPVVCEIDCLILKDNNLLLVSIKSNKVETDDLNEIKVHDVLFGNNQSKPVICINNELNIVKPSTYAKAEELGIYVVDENDFVDNKIVDRFLSIINDTYKYKEL